MSALYSQGIKCELEYKKYSRERSNEPFHTGRVRVHLKNDDGTPVNPNYPTRKSIMYLLADLIPKLKTRASKQSGDQNINNPKKDKGKGKRR
ncbi:Signal recognition particle 19 kDa protein, putative [Pediculus humanus corporis]|uniref:Signal recognition particle 19 kDa protein, putative n=1 Tax=Pediculus humanus subsp. corporis TaxID=121224 RepID=E0VUL6_PEDHC|nr:Signal recognition particle 19 kDa protein, putative [Pediculus humanus corporis]EEB17072.1 Signal recognition particle 19 kDa protein, putative [Pediculus humanus corporis]